MINNHYANPTGTWEMSWDINSRTQELSITVRAKTDKWVGIGFNGQPSMVGADIIVGWVDPNTNEAYISDRTAKYRVMPELDVDLGGRDDVKLQYGYIETDSNGDTWTVISFTRKLGKIPALVYITLLLLLTALNLQ